MRRREFITLFGGAAATWPLAARAQQSATPVIGFLSARSPADTAHLVAAFRKGLGESGFIEGQNVTIEFRWAIGQYDRLSAMAQEFVRRPVAVLVATGGEPAALAAKAATSSIPIIFTIGGDPVSEGLAASFSHPGGNSTGITFLTTQLEPKRLALLHHLVPQAATIGSLLDPSFPGFASQLRDVQDAARVLDLEIHILRATTDDELDAAFETVARQHISALSVAAAPFFDTRRDKVVAFAARYAVPAMYQFREFTEAGGLVSYGTNVADGYRLAGIYTGRVLKGAKPADLPVIEETKFEFVINMKTAKTLGLDVPLGLSAAADELIE
jgi:putative ABC transport system substrate-binding protein